KKIVMLTCMVCIAICSIAQPCTPLGDQVTYGTNNVWIGYVYQSINFTNYRGYVNEGNSTNPNFDQSFGGNNVQYNTNGCPTTTENFSVRYKLTKAFANGSYDFTVGGDDGYRFSIDGGVTWLINQWSDHGYQTSNSTITLNGTYNLVVEYYERSGGNRVSFSMIAACIGNGDPTVYGIGNTWNGYLYQGVNFNNYKGFITRGGVDGIFDENFGTANGSFSTSNCSITTQQFSARFRSRRTFPEGTYLITIGGDDGYRLSFNGGATWAINRWSDQAYTTTSISIYLNGTYDMVLEFYENAGDNRLSYSITTLVLPITLKSWSASLNSNTTARLSWVADAAIDFDHFIIQRSINGTTFNDIKKVKSKNNSTNISYTYEYTDNQLPAADNVYYRLAMVDKDGSIRYSSVQVVSPKPGNNLKVYPTIINNKEFKITTDKVIKNGTVDILTMAGQVIQTIKLNSGSLLQSITISKNIVPATYLIRIRDEKGMNEIHKLIVQ
ncbi:MAG: PA14 domain-containing protein, partial [Chitinophagaceae bacterium]